jgi:hypothetical protein
MSLLKLWYRPAQVFGAMQRSSWFWPLAASAILFLMINGVLVAVVGTNTVIHTARALEPRATVLDANTMKRFIFIGVLMKAVLSVLGAVVGSAVVLVILRLMSASASFSSVLGVCSYVAYAKRAVDLVLLSGLIGGAVLTQRHLPNDMSIRGNAAVFLSEAGTTPILYKFAQSLDALDIGALVFAVFGLTKAVPALGVRRAALAVLSTWGAWVILGVVAR